MSSSGSSDSGRRSTSSAASHLSKRPIDPITRTALRYSISPREYELLHQYLISRAPERVQKRTPDPPRYEKITKARTETGDYNVASFRAALRIFVAAYTGLKGFEVVSQKLAKRRGGEQSQSVTTVGPRLRNARIALSLSSILLFHRLLHRFFKRLRAALLEGSAEPWRERNPTVARLLTSKYTPAIGSSVAGFCLGISPADQLRITIAIYALSRSLEFSYNALADAGHIWRNGKPWWFGSWLIMPFACGQLLHTFVFDRDCFPESYGRFILQRSPEYIQLRPADYPAGKPWPGTFDIVDALAQLSKLRWPAFISPILFPGKQTLPDSLSKINPITAPAHPVTRHASCALLHPQDPSCARVYIKYFTKAFPSVVKFFTLIYGAFALLAYKALLNDPMPFLNRLAARILRISLFVTGSIGTSWGSICLFNHILPRNLLPTQRWFLGGFIGGLWAFVARQKERGNFLYSMRLSIDSLWKVGKKRGWWRGVKNGDVLVFVASLALINAVYEGRPGAIQGSMIRKGMGMLRGEGFIDRADEEKAKLKEEAEGSQDQQREKAE